MPPVWGQGIPLRPARTIRTADSVPSNAAPADLLGQTAPAGMRPSRTVPADLCGRTAPVDMAISPSAPVDTASRTLLPIGSTTSAITSVNDAITRLQRERDLALRRIDELHAHYKKELKSRESDFGRTNADKERAERDLAEARSLIETQKSSIKMLQDKLGVEAEFDAEETAHMRHVRRECESV